MGRTLYIHIQAKTLIPIISFIKRKPLCNFTHPKHIIIPFFISNEPGTKNIQQFLFILINYHVQN